MSQYIRTAQIQAKDKATAKKKQQEIDEKDVGVVNDMFSSVRDLNAEVARSVIVRPNDIIGLTDSSKHHQIKCVYGIHAVLVGLVADDCSDILNSMSDNNIELLKTIILGAQKRPRPNKELIENNLAARLDKKNSQQNDNESFINNAMILSLRLYLHVHSVWDDAVVELKKWADAINGFQRTSLGADNKIVSVQEDIQKKPQKENKSSKKNTQNKHTGNQVEIKSFEVFLTKLNELCEKAKKDLEKAETVYKSKGEEALAETDPRKRTELLNETLRANDDVVQLKENFDKLSASWDEATKLAKKKKKAEDDLRFVNERITEFVDAHKGLVK